MFDPKITHALYKGDNFIAVGNIAEFAEFLKIKESTVRYYTTKAHRRKFKSEDSNRLIVIKITEDLE